MKQIIEKLYNLNRSLISDDTDKSLAILSKEIPLKIIKVPSGTTCFSWTVPRKWNIKKAILKNSQTGKTIIDYKKNPLHLLVGSLPQKREVTYEELKKHLHYHPTNREAIPYVYKFYELDWGFSISKNQFDKLNKKHKFFVDIDTSYTKGNLSIGEATIKGETSDEIIFIAHIDHPYQANDNLSGVAVAAEIYKQLSKIKKLRHTIRILFLPETIGSVAYAWLRKKDFKKFKSVIAFDIVGNDNRLLIQGTFDKKSYLNYLASWIADKQKLNYELAAFREYIGSDELIFSDPEFKIPSIMISTYPYKEYHTHFDNPRIISEKMLINVKNHSLELVKLLDKDFVAKRLWKGPLMRSSIGWFLGKQPEDKLLEIFGYKIDGKKNVIQIAQEIGLNIEVALQFSQALLQKGLVKSV